MQWPPSTPFETAIGIIIFCVNVDITSYSATGPLAGSFPILSLRTNKADVIVAVEKDVAEKLDKSGEKWRYNGKYVCHTSSVDRGRTPLLIVLQICIGVVPTSDGLDLQMVRSLEETTTCVSMTSEFDYKHLSRKSVLTTEERPASGVQ